MGHIACQVSRSRSTSGLSRPHRPVGEAFGCRVVVPLGEAKSSLGDVRDRKPLGEAESSLGDVQKIEGVTQPALWRGDFP
ncbi:hypothetical protein GW17_00046546 [Ensete ventricosum]|nr:hypothetical protein GW17_00046546 [Ensete ventricosum]